jgi:hypothetical protein
MPTPVRRRIHAYSCEEEDTWPTHVRRRIHGLLLICIADTEKLGDACHDQVSVCGHGSVFFFD